MLTMPSLLVVNCSLAPPSDHKLESLPQIYRKLSPVSSEMSEKGRQRCSPAERLWTPHWAESRSVRPHLWLFWQLELQTAERILEGDYDKQTC